MAGIFLMNLVHLRRRTGGATVNPQLFVSVLIPARNEAENLRRLIPSLLNQRHRNFELLVYDDASDDDTWRVINSFSDPRVRPLRGTGPPAGWAGKVHALFQATRFASGRALLFLDADTTLKDSGALERLICQYQQMPAKSVLTGMPHYQGRGLLLVSLVAHALLVSIPWGLLRWLPIPSMAALNGQCWMIDAACYRDLEPHLHVAGEVLEDVGIGKYLKKEGISPYLVDLQREISVFMYASFGDAWRGFRKNVYLLMGNHPASFLLVFSLFGLIFVLSPFIDPRMLILIFLSKLGTDLRSRFSPLISLLAPLGFLLGSTLQLDSAWHNLTGRVTWKGRNVAA